ncbi:Glutaredoxin-like protein, YruB-family [Clostridium acidisoli DSM 12555]|uniref:Glutaredoxin-like protein, YruB-family n=1 Tax=Clostridium acidisoli DSM 12555 TaxID=1121291 RepID=A0A1W1XU64_9CLOT|nr:glutaredoxin domain-containing protein [Clostridium acidisoli]SMC27520.1 Glutaredoxin-like protein, YruB-family [Clostridium acidisoli DSM 12555]
MIKIYSTPTCSWCKKTKEYLKSKNIEYVDVNVADDMEGREEMFKLSEQSAVPVINIDGNIVLGFDKAKIDKLIQK